MKNADDGKNRHGFPQGYHFGWDDHDLMRLLDLKLDGRRLPEPLSNIFRNVEIRDSHPAVLYDQYQKLEEGGYIHFFDHRQYPTKGRNPKRTTKDGGTWKASGRGEELKRGGVVVGYKLTMIFYQQEKPHKTHWALKEYTRIVDGDGPDKKVESLALYRLYKKKAVRGAVRASVEAINHFGYATGLVGWDNMPLHPPVAPSAVAHDLPVWGHSSYLETTCSNSEPLLPPLLLPAPSPAANGYLADEFKVLCESKQNQEEPCGRSPVPCDDLFLDLRKLSCTLEELVDPLQEDMLLDLPMPDANQDDTAALPNQA